MNQHHLIRIIQRCAITAGVLIAIASIAGCEHYRSIGDDKQFYECWAAGMMGVLACFAFVLLMRQDHNHYWSDRRKYHNSMLRLDRAFR